MHLISDRHRRPSSPATAATLVDLFPAGESWISLVGQGAGFHDCPLCRELASGGEPVPATVHVRRESLPLLTRTGWLDDLLELVGPNATVQVMGRDPEDEPVEELSMEAFLARLGYD